LCPYPKIARYAGVGDPEAAASFKCVAPRRSGREHGDQDDDDDRSHDHDDDDDDRGRD
jgi:hypothetical protein